MIVWAMMERDEGWRLRGRKICAWEDMWWFEWLTAPRVVWSDTCLILFLCLSLFWVALESGFCQKVVNTLWRRV